MRLRGTDSGIRDCAGMTGRDVSAAENHRRNQIYSKGRTRIWTMNTAEKRMIFSTMFPD